MGERETAKAFTVFRIPCELLDSFQVELPGNHHSRSALEGNAAVLSNDALAPAPKLSYSVPNVHSSAELLDSKYFGQARKAVAACNTCRVSFESVEEQRMHYRTGWHGFNVSRRVQLSRSGEPDWSPLTKDEFDDLTSGSGSSGGCSLPRITTVSPSMVATEALTTADVIANGVASMSIRERRGLALDPAFIWFSSSSDLQWVYGVRKSILLPKHKKLHHSSSRDLLNALKMLQIPMGSGIVPGDLTLSSVWVILCMSGGQFVGVVLDNRSGRAIAHKTFSRYTTRRKQGGSQYANDNAKGRVARSAGAQLRRYNEHRLIEDVQDLLKSWRPNMQQASCIFVRLMGIKQQQVLGSDGAGLDPGDPRVRPCPVSIKSPTLQDVLDAYQQLIQVKTVKLDGTKAAVGCAPSSTAAAAAAADGSQQVLSGSETPSRDGSQSEDDDNSEDGYDTDSTLEPEARPELVAFLHGVAERMRDPRQTDEIIIAHLDANAELLIDAFLDPALELRYLSTSGGNDPAKTPTLLHLASMLGRSRLIPYLMDNGDDPAVTNGHPPLFTGGKTPYEVARDRETRDAFRRYRAATEGTEDGVDWVAARIPHALTKEQEQERARRAQEKRERMKKKQEKKQQREARMQTGDSASPGRPDIGSTAPPAIAASSPIMSRLAQITSTQDQSLPKRRGRILGTNNPDLQLPNRPISPETRRRLEREIRIRAVEERLKRIAQHQ
ncbi:hypothetical protein EV182_000102 [Spiromyces aspiralis]|uniref:Uncharacterized protein n=1 Tax=Spiromyces aspiralis TaxID=68401 RepID=A0ACC1HYK2_9FUNG|nr:hypothetical protein EV182_000102 [Spiromyces aspiralis]